MDIKCTVLHLSYPDIDNNFFKKLKTRKNGSSFTSKNFLCTINIRENDGLCCPRRHLWVFSHKAAQQIHGLWRYPGGLRKTQILHLMDKHWRSSKASLSSFSLWPAVILFFDKLHCGFLALQCRREIINMHLTLFSTCSELAQVLAPHIQDFKLRWRSNGKEIPDTNVSAVCLLLASFLFMD